MKKAALTVAALLPLTFSSHAFAQDRAALCQLRQSHTTAAASASDASYQPAVDVNGKPVASANLGGSTSTLDIVRIPMTIDLAHQLQTNLPKGTELQAGTGMIEIHNDGKVLYNGQDISSAADATCASSVPDPAQQADANAAPEKHIVHHKKVVHKAKVKAAPAAVDATDGAAPADAASATPATATPPSITATDTPAATAPATAPMPATANTPAAAATTTAVPTGPATVLPAAPVTPPATLPDVTSTAPPAPAALTAQPQGTVSPVPDAHQEKPVPGSHNPPSLPTGN